MKFIIRIIKIIFNKIKNIFMRKNKNKNKEKKPDQDDIYPLW